MALYDLPNMTGGVDETMIQVVTAVPSFITGLLFFVWFMIFLGGTSSQRNKTGYSNYPMWATMASLSTTLIALILSIKEGLMNMTILTICVAVTIFSGLWLFLSQNRGEF